MTTAHRLLRFSLLTRVALLLPATSTALLTLFAPESITAILSAREGAAAAVVLTIMLAIISLGWLDVIINDVLPERWQMRWVRVRRHQGYAALATVYLVKAFAAAGETAAQFDGGAIVLGYYVVIGLCCAWYTWAAALRPDYAL